ncbi:hypothetical protein MVEN_02242200 [Mycena venus]|uniref:Uncharacterized protein n=1 Tax=Mycena venus TaxID=2733690 RepID=A0A8H6X6D9_9AGAR|nr:hypothetical protein MVEN_02242200 [Mycena venus]
MSTPNAPLADTTNTSDTSPAAATDELAKMRVELENMKGLVAGFTKKNRKGKGKKRKRNADASTSDNENDAPASNRPKKSTPPEHEQDFASHGRIIMRFIGPYESIEEIIHHGLKVDTSLLDDEMDESIQFRRLTESWTILHQKFAGLHSLLLANHKNLELIQSISRQITFGMEGARSDDSGTLKPRVVGWSDEDLGPNSKIILMPAISKATCLSDPKVFALILPLEFKNNPDYPDPLALYNAGKLAITSLQYPCFLYPFDQLNDESALDTALSGPVMLRCAKAIMMGPSAALQGDGYHIGKAGIASIIGLKTFTPRVIAYIACQVRFNLSNQQFWNKMDGDFDYEEFFWLIVELFEKDAEFAAKTIALYNRVVLGHSAGLATARTPTASSAPVINNMDRLRAARDARLAAAASSSSSV